MHLAFVRFWLSMNHPASFSINSFDMTSMVSGRRSPVAAPAGDAVLAGALSVGLVADLARCADGMAVAGLARPLVADGALLVAEVSLLAVVAVAAGRVVAALEADAAGDAARQLVQLHVEAAAPRVVVALAGHALVGGGRRGAAPRPVEVEA